MRCLEAVDDRIEHALQLVVAERAALCEPLRQRLAGERLGDDVGRAVGVHAGQYADDARVVEPRQDPSGGRERRQPGVETLAVGPGRHHHVRATPAAGDACGEVLLNAAGATFHLG